MEPQLGPVLTPFQGPLLFGGLYPQPARSPHPAHSWPGRHNQEWNLTSGNLLRRRTGRGAVSAPVARWHHFLLPRLPTLSPFNASLPFFYSLFNVCGSAPLQVRRVTVAVTGSDPVHHRGWPAALRVSATGNLLVITWPFSILDQAAVGPLTPIKRSSL